ncbi:MAG TPA: LemA family protein [Alphaproteobacteria bacterium]|nr:LemA family protein [Alphaproteobacteria bacterium]
MKKFLIFAGVFVAICFVILAIGYSVFKSSYNNFVGLSQAADNKWAQVENVYQRRADLIPNLVATVSGAANFEKSTLVEVTQARASVGKVQINANAAPTDPNQLAQFDQAQQQLTSALSHLMVVVEKYPNLTATENFRDLQAQLEGTENRIAVARMDFNNAVQAYDTAIKSFPAVLFAGALHFNEKPYFAAAPGAENAPKVQFNFNGNSTN